MNRLEFYARMCTAFGDTLIRSALGRLKKEDLNIAVEDHGPYPRIPLEPTWVDENFSLGDVVQIQVERQGKPTWYVQSIVMKLEYEDDACWVTLHPTIPATVWKTDEKLVH